MRTLLLLVLLVGVCVFGWLIAKSQNDQDAPIVSSDVYYLGNIVQTFDTNTWRLPATDPFTLSLQSNEVTEFSLSYGETELKKVSRKFDIPLDALSGQNAIEVLAKDRNGNQAVYNYSLAGLPAVSPLIQAPTEVLPGEAFSINIALPPNLYGVNAGSIEAKFLGEELTVFDNSFASTPLATALAVIPLGKNAGEYPIEVSMSDAFGRVSKSEQVVRLMSKSQTLQNINLPADLLSLRNLENQLLEADVVATAIDNSLNKATPLWAEDFISPIDGTTSSDFGIPRQYGVGGDIAFHTGTDIMAAEGTAIRATNDGVIMVSGYYPIKGGFIMIDHGGGVQSLYFHQAEGLLVREGQRVKKGDLIGKVGSTGLSTGPHLHWEIRVNNQPTQASSWVGKILP